MPETKATKGKFALYVLLAFALLFGGLAVTGQLDAPAPAKVSGVVVAEPAKKTAVKPKVVVPRTRVVPADDPTKPYIADSPAASDAVIGQFSARKVVPQDMGPGMNWVRFHWSDDVLHRALSEPDNWKVTKVPVPEEGKALVFRGLGIAVINREGHVQVAVDRDFNRRDLMHAEKFSESVPMAEFDAWSLVLDGPDAAHPTKSVYDQGFVSKQDNSLRLAGTILKGEDGKPDELLVMQAKREVGEEWAPPMNWMSNDLPQGKSWADLVASLDPAVFVEQVITLPSDQALTFEVLDEAGSMSEVVAYGRFKAEGNQDEVFRVNGPSLRFTPAAVRVRLVPKSSLVWADQDDARNFRWNPTGSSEGYTGGKFAWLAWRPGFEMNKWREGMYLAIHQETEEPTKLHLTLRR